MTQVFQWFIIKNMNRKEFLAMIGGMWIFGFFSAISETRFVEESTSGGEKVDVDFLKRKAEEGQVSMKEADFYEPFEEKNRQM